MALDHLMSQELTQSLPWDLLCKTLQGHQGQPRPEWKQDTLPKPSSTGLQRPPQSDKMFISGPLSGALHPAVMLPAHPGPLPPCQAPPTAAQGHWQSGTAGPAAPTQDSGHLFSPQKQFHMGEPSPIISFREGLGSTGGRASKL